MSGDPDEWHPLHRGRAKPGANPFPSRAGAACLASKQRAETRDSAPMARARAMHRDRQRQAGLTVSHTVPSHENDGGDPFVSYDFDGGLAGACDNSRHEVRAIAELLSLCNTLTVLDSYRAEWVVE